MKTLLLNAFNFPIRVIPWENAVKRLYEGTVDVVVSYKDVVSSPSVTMAVPAVLREKRVVNVKHVVRFSRSNVFLRDRYKCQYCGHKFDQALLEFDHVVPWSHGGKTTWENIVTCCRDCNAQKGNRECDEIGMHPINKPVRPKSLPSRAPRIRIETAPLEWLAYLPV